MREGCTVREGCMVREGCGWAYESRVGIKGGRKSRAQALVPALYLLAVCLAGYHQKRGGRIWTHEVEWLELPPNQPQ